MIDPKENILMQEPPIASTFPWSLLFMIILGFIMYYLVKYSTIFSKNTEDVSKITLEDIKQNIKNTLRLWKESFESYRDQYMFESHITNGVFRK